MTSSVFTLEDGETYRLQVKVTSIPQNGDLYSADLVFEQETSDSQGLLRTVGWYPSVTAVTEVATNGADLGFLLRAPEIIAPEVRRTWSFSAAQLTGSNGVKIDLQDLTAGSVLATTTVSVHDSSFSRLERDAIASAAATNQLDSRAILGPGTTGKVSSSVLRVAIDLHSASAPILSLATSDAAFSPNGDEIKDMTLLLGTVDDVTLEDWSLQIFDSDQEVVQTYSSGDYTLDDLSAGIWWTALDGETALPDGEYLAKLTASDATSLTASTSVPLIVDTDQPRVAPLSVVPQRHSAVVGEFRPAALIDDVDPSPAVGMEILDNQTLDTVVIPPASVNRDGGWVWGEEVEVIPGHTYSIRFSLEDWAGNTALSSSFGPVAAVDPQASASPLETAQAGGCQDDPGEDLRGCAASVASCPQLRSALRKYNLTGPHTAAQLASYIGSRWLISGCKEAVLLNPSWLGIRRRMLLHFSTPARSRSVDRVVRLRRRLRATRCPFPIYCSSKCPVLGKTLIHFCRQGKSCPRSRCARMPTCGVACVHVT